MTWLVSKMDHVDGFIRIHEVTVIISEQFEMRNFDAVAIEFNKLDRNQL